MNKRLKTLLYILIGVMVFWGVLTLWAEYGGEQKATGFGKKDAPSKALIIYNPDPIYNLDEQVCTSFAKGLTESNFYAEVSTVELAKDTSTDYNLYVFCSNTYNWAPDWLITNYISSHDLQGKNTVAITLGSGSTDRAKRLLEEAISNAEANLIASEQYWLLRPNDENRMEESNVAVANDMANELGKNIGKKLTREL